MVPEPVRTMVAEEAAPLLRKGYMAHLAGDESITDDEMAELVDFRDNNPLGPDFGNFIFGVAMCFWTDLPIQDNFVSMDLTPK